MNSQNFKSRSPSKKIISKNNDLHEVYLIHQKTPIKKNLNMTFKRNSVIDPIL